MAQLFGQSVTWPANPISELSQTGPKEKGTYHSFFYPSYCALIKAALSLSAICCCDKVFVFSCVLNCPRWEWMHSMHRWHPAAVYPAGVSELECSVEKFLQSVFNSSAVINTCILITAHELKTFV